MAPRMIEPETTSAQLPNYERWPLAKKVAFLMELHATRSVIRTAMEGVWPLRKSGSVDAGA
jgi:hypothetical protein